MGLSVGTVNTKRLYRTGVLCVRQKNLEVFVEC